MPDNRILIVGAGPAGLSAAATLAKAGQEVIVAEQAPTVGGAVYAQNRTGVNKVIRKAPQITALLAAVAAHEARIDIRCGSSFVGLDYQGNALLSGAQGLMFRPKAVIMATGARELVRPRPGWTLPGVATVGALQVGLKTSGRPPKGRIAIAGSGPLLYALGAQLTRAGSPPRAIIEAARPFRHALSGLRLPAPVLREAAGYMLTLLRARVPILTGVALQSITQNGDALHLQTSATGRFSTLTVDWLGLHDGLARNDYGVDTKTKVPVIAAGDCRAVLGRFAAAKDGENAALAVLEQLGIAPSGKVRNTLLAEENAQETLGKIFAHDSSSALLDLPDDTILCRCENRSVADLRAIPEDERTPRILRLNGRFGMGACQGRFCLDWVSRIADGNPDPSPIRGQRWPLRPVSVEDILNAADASGDDTHFHPEKTT